LTELLFQFGNCHAKRYAIPESGNRSVLKSLSRNENRSDQEQGIDASKATETMQNVVAPFSLFSSVPFSERPAQCIPCFLKHLD
jgi:hypothetical protein